MIILVTTAGKVGQEVATALLESGHEVRLGSRTPAKLAGLVAGAKPVAFDYEAPKGFASAVAGVDAVFSAAPYWLLPNAELALFDAVKAAGARRLVKLGALGANLDPAAPHAIAEKALKASGLDWAVVRPNFFMENYSTMSAASIKAGAIYEPAGEGKTSFIDTRDIGAVAAKIIDRPELLGRGYDLTGPEALDRHEIATILAEVSGRPVAYVPVDDAALRKAMTGAPPSLIELMSMLFGAVRAGHTATVLPTVEEVLGRSPISFARFAADHAAIWR